MALSAVLLAAGLLPAPLQARTPVAGPAAPAACPPVLQHRFKRLQDEAPQDLCQYAGKVLLVVNTASFCGFTGQYEGLERLFARLGPRGLVVLGFPSNAEAHERGGVPGRVLAGFPSEKPPDAADLVARIEQALAER